MSPPMTSHREGEETLTANALVREVLGRSLPPGVPAAFERIDAARFEGKGRARRAVAELTFRDGQRGIVEVWQWALDSWAHRWVSVGGAPLYWTGVYWARDLEQETPPLDVSA